MVKRNENEKTLADLLYEASSVKERITINIDEDIIEYFKRLSEKTGSPYQTLINKTLRLSIDGKTLPDEMKLLKEEVVSMKKQLDEIRKKMFLK